MKRLAITIVSCVGLFVFGWAQPALAHNTLVDAVPAKEATLTEAPAGVKLTFLQALKPDTKLTVTDATGASAIGPATVDGKVVSAPFTGTSGGVYTVGYELLSEDGHPVKNSYTFTLQLPTPTTQAPAPAPESAAAVAPTSADDESGPPWLPYILGAAVAGFLLGGLIVWFRRKRPQPS